MLSFVICYYTFFSKKTSETRSIANIVPYIIEWRDVSSSLSKNYLNSFIFSSKSVWSFFSILISLLVSKKLAWAYSSSLIWGSWSVSLGGWIFSTFSFFINAHSFSSIFYKLSSFYSIISFSNICEISF
jgi:hypothetical protein